MQEVNEVFFDNIDSPCVIDFYTDWCVPCKALKSTLESLESENNNLKIVAVNIENAPSLAEKFGIVSVPTVLFIDGDRQKKIIGLFAPDTFQKFIDMFFTGEITSDQTTIK